MKKRNDYFMRTVLVFCTAFLLTIYAHSQSHDNYFFNVGFNDDTDMNLYAFVDPTFTDDGEQYGIGFKKEFRFFYVGVEVSTYQALEPSYTDAIFMLGTTINLKRFDITGGGRIGLVKRKGNPTPLPLMGLEVSFLYHITNKLSAGFRFWVDERQDQKDEFYGDSDTYDSGIIFTNELSQENGAFIIVLTVN